MPSRPDHIALKATISTARANPRLQKLALTHKRASNGDSKLTINGNLLREKFNNPDFDKKEKEKTMRFKARQAKESARKDFETERDGEFENEADEAAEFENDDEVLDEDEEEIIGYEEDEFFNR